MGKFPTSTRCEALCAPYLSGATHPDASFSAIGGMEIGFHHVLQAGLELLTSASRSAEITGVSHRAWPKRLTLYGSELQSFYDCRQLLEQGFGED
ncbi:Protein GVQW1, partial [Plecturocebus cupreus]